MGDKNLSDSVDNDELRSPKEPAKLNVQPSESWKAPQNLLALAQLILLVAGGMAAVYIFFVVDRPTKTKFDDTLMIRDLGPASDDVRHKYLVEYSYEISNQGLLSQDVHFAIVTVFKADLVVSDNKAVIINSHRFDGEVEWELLFTQGYRPCDPAPPKEGGPKNRSGGDGTCDSEDLQESDQRECQSEYWKDSFTSEYSCWYTKNRNPTDYLRGGGGVGRIDANESSGGALALTILAEPRKSLIAFELRFGIDGKYNPENIFRFRTVDLLVHNAD